jgi:hypothetical protein
MSSGSGFSCILDDEEHDPENPPRLERQLTELGPPVKVARLKRRGLFRFWFGYDCRMFSSVRGCDDAVGLRFLMHIGCILIGGKLG